MVRPALSPPRAQIKFGWNPNYSAIYMDFCTIAPGVGAVLAMRVLFPSFGYAWGLALTLGLATVASAYEGLATSSKGVLAGVFAASLSWGVYPSITAMLTPEESAENQGHLQVGGVGRALRGTRRRAARRACAVALVSFGTRADPAEERDGWSSSRERRSAEALNVTGTVRRTPPCVSWQGALYALTTFGSVLALYGYLYVTLKIKNADSYSSLF